MGSIHSKNYNKITFTERDAFQLKWNLADAQVYVTPSEYQKQILNDLSSVFSEARKLHLDVLKQNFAEVLFNFHKQYAALAQNNSCLYCYSASIAIEIAINFLNSVCADNRKVGLIYPTFDNLYHMLKRHHLIPIPLVESKPIPEQLAIDLPRAVLLTLPNNPTGFDLQEDEFKDLCSFCAQNDILIIIDCCYRYYAERFYDQYKILADYNVDYVLVEDTGKLFPILDIKLGVLCSNIKIFTMINDIHSDFLLEASKFNLHLITSLFKQQSEKDRAKYLNTVSDNRKMLISTLEPFGIGQIGGKNINVQLMKLPNNISADIFEQYVATYDVGIISGRKLFWLSKGDGDSTIRFALSRDQSYFLEALDRVTLALNDNRLDFPFK